MVVGQFEIAHLDPLAGAQAEVAMVVSPPVRKAIEAEIAHLEAQRQKLDLKIEALREMIMPTTAPTQPKGRKVSAVRHATPEKEVAGGNGHGPGLRAMLVNALSLAPHGLNLDGAVQKIEGMGFRPNGTTPVRVRITAELYRLKREGKVIKKGRDFRLLEATASQ
jgi:hypothetical protein